MRTDCQRKARHGVLDMTYLERRLDSIEAHMEELESTMPKKKIYQCQQCEAVFKGHVDYSYHMRAHIRVSLSPPPAPKPLRSTRDDPYPQGTLW